MYSEKAKTSVSEVISILFWRFCQILVTFREYISFRTYSDNAPCPVLLSFVDPDKFLAASVNGLPPDPRPIPTPPRPSGRRDGNWTNSSGVGPMETKIQLPMYFRPALKLSLLSLRNEFYLGKVFNVKQLQSEVLSNFWTTYQPLSSCKRSF